MIPAAATRPVPLRETVLSDLHPAIRLAGTVLGIASTFATPTWLLPFVWLLLLILLVRTGLSMRHLAMSLRPWAPVALLVVLTHTLTTTAAAPLGHPSLTGLLRGLVALLRVACTMTWLALYVRTTSLPELVAGLAWWLAPLERLGVRTADLGLAVAVMIGTVPQVMAESRRVELVSRLRETGPTIADLENPGQYVPPQRVSLPRRLWRALLRRARLIVPLMEALARRAEALTLSLRTRRPTMPVDQQRPPLGQLVLLAVWLVGLVWLGVYGGGERVW